jgi:RNA polymerase sigma-70 factor (ECF subfamily)
MLTSDNVREALDEYGDMLYRICLVMLRNTADAEDAVEETFIKYMLSSPQFNDDEHEKAWLITVAANKCRDMLRSRKRHITESDDILRNYSIDRESTGVLEALMEVPEKYRIVLTLHYIEGYKVDEIAEMIGKTSSAVKMRLAKGRELLKEKLK